MNRREFLMLTAAGTFGTLFFPASASASSGINRLVQIEQKRGGRLGVAIWNTGNSHHVGHHADERFMLCSTYKLLLVAYVLARIDSGREQSARRVVFDKKALLDWAPVTQHHTGLPGMTIERLCKAAIVSSDNTAANVLMESVGGPTAVTTFVRGLCDMYTRIDRLEPELNRPDGEKDTTTPRAIVHTAHTLLLGKVLSNTSRQNLLTWMNASQTGVGGLRKGLPARWQIGEKTGANRSANNDIAIIQPEDNEPILVAVYYENARLNSPGRKQVLAEVGRFVGERNAT
jgi:beta-lactamase class A